MTIRKNIEEKLNNALKEKDKVLISTLRLILAAIKDKDIASRSKDSKNVIENNDIIQLLKKMIKQRKESIEIYKNNNRKDLLDVEEKEVLIITGFLPKQLGDEETKKICNQVIENSGAKSIKDMGKVMGILKKDYAENIDFGKAGAILKEILK